MHVKTPRKGGLSLLNQADHKMTDWDRVLLCFYVILVLLEGIRLDKGIRIEEGTSLSCSHFSVYGIFSL